MLTIISASVESHGIHVQLSDGINCSRGDIFNVEQPVVHSMAKSAIARKPVI